MAEITNQLLKDAIADAEAVRQTAIANAKIALEETFTPQIKSMLARRLRAEATMEDEGTMKDETAKEVPNQDATPVSGGGPEDTSTIGTGDNKEPSAASWDSSDIDQGSEGHGDSKKDWYDDWSASDFDLDEVIKELEEDILGEKKEEEEEELDEAKKEEEEELDEAKKEEEEEELEEGWKEEGMCPKCGSSPCKCEEDEAVVDPTATAHTPPEAAMKHTMAMQKKGDDKPTASADAPMGAKGSEEDEMVDPMKGQQAHGFAVPEETKGHEEEGGEEELDLEAILRELEADGHHKEEDDASTMAHKMEALQNELAEYRKAVNLLRGKLQEVNLLNAKLLFTNKLFRNDRLTNEQKVAIVENFDRATTVREVKIVYTTLVETLNSTAKAMTGRKTTKVVTEGLASKPTKSTAPKTEILEENSVAKRLQQLAGIL